MRFAILLCLIWCAQSSCLSVLPGEVCEQIQEAGQRLSESIGEFDKLLQNVVMRCFEETQLITESSLKFMLTKTASIQSKVSQVTTAMESDAKIQQIFLLMATRLDASFNTGHGTFFALLKKAAIMVVADNIVTDALLSYSNTGRKKRSLQSIDDKIKSLRQEMNTSLSGVEQNLHGVAGQLFTMFTDSLKDLVNDQQYKTNIENWRKDMGKYLVQAIHVVVDSHIERFFLILKHSAQQIEIIDSLVANFKNDPTKLAKAIQPAKLLIDEAIQNLNKMLGTTEMKRQLKLKLDWMQAAYKNVKAKIMQG